MVLVVLSGVGCGARTGLHAPDAGPANMVDAEVPEVIPCYEVPFDGGVVRASLEIEAELGKADVTFLIDTTASMREEIDRVRDQLRDRLAPAIDEAIPDVQFAVATFADFPVDPYGSRELDVPFRLMLPSTDDLNEVQAAVDAIRLGDGVDEAESQVEALYQLATGAGIGSFVPPSAGCPSGGLGYPCYRVDALPVVLLFTDAPFHNGPSPLDSHRYGPQVAPAPHSYVEAIEAMASIGGRVIGLSSGGADGERDLRAVARDTEAFDEAGDPLVFDIGRMGERLGTGVVSSIRTFADNVIFDVDAFASDADPDDGVDATMFIEAIVPVSAFPADRVEQIDREARVFRGARAGTFLTFELLIVSGAVVPGTEPKAFLLQVNFRGDGRTLLGSRLVTIVIPSEDHRGCEDLPDAGGFP